MKNSEINGLLVNVGFGLTVIVTAGFMVYSLFSTETVPPCSSRHTEVHELTLQTADGRLMTPIELQANIGGGGRYIADHAKVLPVPGGPASAAIEVALEKGTSSVYQSDYPHGGVAFQWAPDGLNGAEVACLRYSIRLPADFDFDKAGMLPGVFGGVPPQLHESPDGESGFATRLIWRKKGLGEVFAQVPDKSPVNGRILGRGKFSIPKGRWVNLEQEVLLNSLDTADGVYRLWVDRQLVVEHTDLTWRTSDALTLTGVVADVSYGAPSAMIQAPKNTVVQLSPFELSWRSSAYEIE